MMVAKMDEPVAGKTVSRLAVHSVSRLAAGKVVKKVAPRADR